MVHLLKNWKSLDYGHKLYFCHIVKYFVHRKSTTQSNWRVLRLNGSIENAQNTLFCKRILKIWGNTIFIKGHAKNFWLQASPMDGPDSGHYNLG